MDESCGFLKSGVLPRVLLFCPFRAEGDLCLGAFPLPGALPLAILFCPFGAGWIYGLEGLPIIMDVSTDYPIFAPLGCVCLKGKQMTAPCRARGGRGGLSIHLLPEGQQ